MQQDISLVRTMSSSPQQQHAMHCLVGRPKNFMIITSISPICVSLKDLSNRHANGAHGEQATVAAAPWKLNYSPPSCLTMLGGCSTAAQKPTARPLQNCGFWQSYLLSRSFCEIQRGQGVSTLIWLGRHFQKSSSPGSPYRGSWMKVYCASWTKDWSLMSLLGESL